MQACANTLMEIPAVNSGMYMVVDGSNVIMVALFAFVHKRLHSDFTI